MKKKLQERKRRTCASPHFLSLILKAEKQVIFNFSHRFVYKNILTDFSTKCLNANYIVILLLLFFYATKMLQELIFLLH